MKQLTFPGELKSVLVGFLILFFTACNSDKTGKESAVTSEPKPEQVKPLAATPEVNGDSAYAFVKKQVDFGPRVPGSKAHAACGEWLRQKLDSYIPGTIIQTGTATTFDKRKFTIQNIIASYNPQIKKRILLCGHWDTRPFADRDTGPNKNKPLDGANDGGSCVAVLLEVARVLSLSKPDIGVDIILFDLEDYGQPEDSNYPEMNDSWCLGSQYWARNPHKDGYFAQFGILLDMVGAKGAVFPREGTSMRFAEGVVDKVWSTAEKMGYGSYFINATTGMTTDDHLYINQLANIPCIDIVHYNTVAADYFPHHHRVTDNMDQIDPQVLKMTGQLLIQVIFDEAQKSN
ncbi:MAG TPA: M28 family peptidase [Bacteroidia bacterium]|nr:M28 family peptidase [Bacteroidia bacterium]